jgi:hypothetical protein
MLNVTFLNFLENPLFVIPWYLVGIVAAVWVAWDVVKVNTRVNTALKFAWPIIMIFFSVIGPACIYNC